MSAVEITKKPVVREELNPILATGGTESAEPIPVTCGPGDDEKEEEGINAFMHFINKSYSMGHTGDVPMEGVIEEEPTDLVTGLEGLDKDEWEVKISHPNEKDKTKITLKIRFNNLNDKLVTIKAAKTGKGFNEHISFPESGCTVRCTQAKYYWIVNITLVNGEEGKELRYQFSTGEYSGEFYPNPTGAFTSAYERATGHKPPPYISGRMLVGIFYPEVQSLIVAKFGKKNYNF